jgi:hypothetical protein
MQAQWLLGDVQFAARQVNEHSFGCGGPDVQTEYRFAHALLVVRAWRQATSAILARNAVRL